MWSFGTSGLETEDFWQLIQDSKDQLAVKGLLENLVILNSAGVRAILRKAHFYALDLSFSCTHFVQFNSNRN